MNRLEINKKSIIPLTEVAKHTQISANENLMNMMYGMFSNTSGVITDMFGDGISQDDAFKVSRYGAKEILISPGFAIDPNGEAIVLTTAKRHPWASSDTSTMYVRIYHSELNVSTGKEKSYPGHVGSIDSMLLLRKDSCLSAVESNEDDPNGVTIAKLILEGGELNTDVSTSISLTTEDRFLDSNDTGEVNIVAPSPTPYDSGFARIGREYVTCDLTGSPSKINVTSRGAESTPAGIYRDGEAITFTSIIDLRHNNKLMLKLGLPNSINQLFKGFINFGPNTGGDRVIQTKKIPDAPIAPVISEDDVSLVWLNKATSGGYLTKELKDYSSQSAGVLDEIDSINSEIIQTRQLLSGETDGEEILSLTTKLIGLQADITEQNVLRKTLQGHVSNLKRNTATQENKFVASLLIPEAEELIDAEAILYYEAMVEYLPINKSKVQNISMVKNQIFSKKLTAESVSVYGDLVYPENVTEEYRQILVPIKRGERIRVKVRAHTISLPSVWSNTIEYVFDEQDDQDFVDSSILSDLLSYDPLRENIINEEMLDMIKSATKALKDATDTINQNSLDIEGLKEQVAALIADNEANKIAIAVAQPNTQTAGM